MPSNTLNVTQLQLVPNAQAIHRSRVFSFQDCARLEEANVNFAPLMIKTNIQSEAACVLLNASCLDCQNPKLFSIYMLGAGLGRRCARMRGLALKLGFNRGRLWRHVSVRNCRSKPRRCVCARVELKPNFLGFPEVCVPHSLFTALERDAMRP
jgi:hypothetical protein